MPYQYKYNKSLVNFSKINRKIQTEAEKTLWFHLKGRQLQGYKFRRQYPIGNFILDFYCVEKKLAIELDGSQHIEQESYDKRRKEYLERFGIRILRFWDNDVLKQTKIVLEKILSVLENV